MSSSAARWLTGAMQAGLVGLWPAFTIDTAVGQEIHDCGTEPVDAWVSADWHESLDASRPEELAAERIVAVPPATQPDAVATLASRPIVALSDADLDALFPDGRPAGAPPGKLKPHLVRGILANERGAFHGYALAEHLWIANHTLGCYRMSKAPVVVFADREPRILHVGVGADF